jgi:hypothetical protein
MMLSAFLLRLEVNLPMFGERIALPSQWYRSSLQESEKSLSIGARIAGPRPGCRVEFSDYPDCLPVVVEEAQGATKHSQFPPLNIHDDPIWPEIVPLGEGIQSCAFNTNLICGPQGRVRHLDTSHAVSAGHMHRDRSGSITRRKFDNLNLRSHTVEPNIALEKVGGMRIGFECNDLAFSSGPFGQLKRERADIRSDVEDERSRTDVLTEESRSFGFVGLRERMPTSRGYSDLNSIDRRPRLYAS